MLSQNTSTELFSQYYARWIKVYKEGATIECLLFIK